MGRSGYSEVDDNWALIRWRGCVASAIRGARGQKLLRELAAALDAMPEKRLVAGALQDGGDYCALGVVGAARGVDLDPIDSTDQEAVAAAFDIARPLAAEIAFENDEGGSWHGETPEDRWSRMRAWVASKLVSDLKGKVHA